PLLNRISERIQSNGIQIRHADNSVASYWHIHQGGARVRKGQRVKQGDVIAESGNVGFSTSPHLHFSVYAGEWHSGAAHRVGFRDVGYFGGIPRLGLRYTWGNKPLP